MLSGSVESILFGWITMEYRKLISFGKSSYVVSLPKSWVNQSKLKKGDLIYIEESGPSLVLNKKDDEKASEEKEKVILVDGKPITQIGREVSAAYIRNYRQITFKGKETRTKIKELQHLIQSHIALEIMEQTGDSIIAKDFLNMEKVNLLELIRKMDVVTRTMFNESCSIFSEDTYDSINDRDKDVNKLYFLLYRAALYNLENPMKSMKNLKLGVIDLMRIHNYAFYIEAIADEVRRTVRYARLLKISPAKQKQIEQLLRSFQNYYLETMKAIYNNEEESALRLSEMKVGFEGSLDLLEKEVQKIDNLNQTINRMRRMITCIHNLGRVAYTLN